MGIMESGVEGMRMRFSLELDKGGRGTGFGGKEYFLPPELEQFEVGLKRKGYFFEGV
jgi:hypothetical protein